MSELYDDNALRDEDHFARGEDTNVYCDWLSDMFDEEDTTERIYEKYIGRT